MQAVLGETDGTATLPLDTPGALFMTTFGKRQLLKHLGTIRGSGNLSIGAGSRSLGSVSYEIDSFVDRMMYSANGQIEGDTGLLAEAFKAGTATLALDGGRSVAVVLADPEGSPTAEIVVRDQLPL